ncbi:proteasome subunit alpha type-4-like [Scaptodrosophila lebanonensis]|uniref:Proteasome subunit alpha type-4-like n=1 Tax=Drosophila lebanonensis TaxID=7225 RepID=A0A6J2UDJ9_DROLE|nr:proteasome subunit alpha type-4-like [Scaptodrosophila lebanonensis]
MARQFDTRPTIFSSEGRLYQVEYAIETVSYANPCLGIKTEEGIVLVAEHNSSNHCDRMEKIYQLNENTLCGTAGIASDVQVLVGEARAIGQRFQFCYGAIMPTEQLTSHLCDIMQAHTQTGGKRPFGVYMLFAGWDKELGYQLLQSDPSGNYTLWRAVCIGKNFLAATHLLEQELANKTGSISLEDAKQLALRALSRTSLATELLPDMVEVATLQRLQDKTLFTRLEPSEVQALFNKQKAKPTA